jgi:hypothetical protein
VKPNTDTWETADRFPHRPQATLDDEGDPDHGPARPDQRRGRSRQAWADQDRPDHSLFRDPANLTHFVEIDVVEEMRDASRRHAEERHRQVSASRWLLGNRPRGGGARWKLKSG